jgi:tRNA pseudouridine55 synthase
VSVECAAGFYVRSLAHELGLRLGTGAHLAALRRTVSAGLTLGDALPLGAAERSRDDAIAAIVPLDRMLPGFPSVVLTDEGAERAAHGRDIGVEEISGAPGSPRSIIPGPVRLFNQRGQLIGLAEPAVAPGLLHPSVVLM